MTHNMVWTAEHCRWLCYECGRVDEATEDGDFVQNEVLGDARVPHIRNRMGIMRPEKPLPKRDPLAYRDPGDDALLRGTGPGMPMPGSLSSFMRELFGVGPAGVAPEVEDLIVEKHFMTAADENWLLQRGIGHD